MKNYISIAGLVCAAVLSTSCGEKDAVQDITAAVPGAGVKFFNFGVNAPAVNFFANDTKMTAISSVSCATPPISETCMTTGIESTAGVGYGGVGAGGFYSGIEPGQYTLSGKIAATVDKNLAISNVTTTLVDGSFYSFYQSGFYNTTTKTVEAFVVQDNLPALDHNAAYVRFVHAISNAAPMTLYARHTVTTTEVAVGGEAAYMAGGAFTALPFGVYDLSTRFAGLTTNALSRTGVSFVAGRVYTITARGDILTAPNATACPATSRTCLDNTLNR